MSWTSDRVENLKKMWSEGQSASQIAKDLGGVTRNAVIGKIHRLGLSNRGPINQKVKNAGPIDESSANLKELKKRNPRKAAINSGETNLNQENHTNTVFGSVKTDSYKPAPQSMSKAVIFTANQPLPPQPSTSEISEETLKNVKSIEKKSKKLTLMELTERTCKWPIGDPATEKFWFCGHTAEPGKPYCETHIEIAFQPMAARREKRSR